MGKAAVKRKAAPKKMVFEWGPVADAENPELTEAEKKFNATAERLMKAVTEINETLKEAHDNSDMRVELWAVPDEFPRQYHYRIYRLTHAVWTYKASVTVGDKHAATPFWKRKLEPVAKPETEGRA